MMNKLQIIMIMQKKVKTLLLILSVIITIIAIKSCKSTISISEYSKPIFTENSSINNNNIELSLSIIETGYGEAPESFVYKGGSLFKKRKLSHIAVLIQHPKGNFVFDTGLGSEIEEQFHNNVTSFMDKQFFKFTKVESLREALIKNNFNIDSVDFIIASHLHNDHVGGIKDFPKATILTTIEEYNYAMSEEAHAPTYYKEQYNESTIKWDFIDFKEKPYQVFSRSYDVFDDGTIVLVPLPGHTKGSIGMFVNLQSGKQYFFIGDLTWALEAIEIPSEKQRIMRKKVDNDRDIINESIVLVHHLLKKTPKLKVIPSHDFNAQKSIAHFPNVEK